MASNKTALKKKYDDIVVFNTANGPVSNHPGFDLDEFEEYSRFAQGVSEEVLAEDESSDDDLDEAGDSEDEAGDSDDDEDAPEDDEAALDYSKLTGAELKTIAAERGVDITGLTKVKQVRAALEAAENKE